MPGQRCLVERLGLAKRTQGRPCAAIPGAVHVADIPAKKLKDYWRRSLTYAESVYGNTCAWYGLRIHPGSARTIDHFLPKEHYPGLAYEWSNYRLALLDANRIKGSAVGLIDPFEVQDDWFALNPLDGSLMVRQNAIPPQLLGRVHATVQTLCLNSPALKDYRLQWIRRFLQGEVTRSVLEEDAPVVSRHV